MASDDAALFGVHQITLATGNAGVANPYDTDFRVVFTPPSGLSVTVNGFYDGGTVWSARVYVTEVGTWTWSTSSATDPGLDNLSGSFSAVASGLRGKLRKHPHNNQRWATEDGRFFLAMADTPYLLFNDECSTYFNPECTEDLFHRYVQQIAAKAVSLLRVGYGGGYHGWDPDYRGPDGKYPKANWIHDGWDYDRFDLSQLRKSDERLAWLLDNYPDIYVDLHLLPKINSPGPKWFGDLTEEQRLRTLKVLVARLAAFPNILYLIERDISQTDEPNREMCRQVGVYLAENDPWDTLRACSEKAREYNQLTLPSDFDTWASYLEVEHWGYPHDAVINWYYNNIAYLPVHVFHGENTYEKPYISKPLNPAYFYRRMFWSALLSGGSGAFGSYYKSIIPYDESGDTDYWSTDGLTEPYRAQLTGLDDLIPIRTFFEQHDIDLADFVPDDQLGLLKDSVAPEGDAGPSKVQAAHDGVSRYLFYHPNAADGEQESPDISVETGELVDSRNNASLRADRTPGIIANLAAGIGRTYNVEWFHPVTGQSYAGGVVDGGATVTLTAPPAFHGYDAVLFLTEIINEHSPRIDDVTTSVAEDAANGAVVIDLNDADTGTDTDLDGEALGYTITASNGAGVFAIDAATGVISVADNSDLDYETTPQYVLTVQASDGTTPVSATVTVDVSNIVNEHSPRIDDVMASVAEDATNGAVVIDLNDADTGTDTDPDGEPLTYSLSAGNSDGVFGIAADTGILSVVNNASLGYETTPQYVLTVQASDGTTPVSATVTVDVSNVVNEHSPRIDDVTTSVAEDAAIGAVVIDLNDADTGTDTDLDGEALGYTITAGNGAGVFAIDAATGVISVADNSDLDYETTPQYVLTVQASDGTTPVSATVTVDVSNVVEMFADGDLAPWDHPDGQINAADLLIATQLVTGRRTPGPLQFSHGDMNMDNVIDVADLLLIQQAVLH